MATRGSYAKGVAKRAEILDEALRVIARNGYGNATVKELADAVSLSQNGLLHYFGSKDALLLAVLRHYDEIIAAEVSTDPEVLATDLGARVITAVEASAAEPGLIQLALQLSVEASHPGHPNHAALRERNDASLDASGEAIRALQRLGGFDAAADPEIVGRVLIALMDGLRLQWMYDEDVDLGAHAAYVLRALGLSIDSAADPDA